MENYSLSHTEILPCYNDTSQCYDPFGKIIDGLNCLSIIINILHLLVLSQIKEIKANYFWILMNLGVSDVLYSISSIAFYNCETREAILQLSRPTSYWMSKLALAAIGCAACLRFLAFFVSSFEKYIGVCKPYEYSTHFFIRNIKSVSVLIYFLGLLSSFAHIMIPEIKFCWTPLATQMVPKTLEYNVVYISFGIQNIILSQIISAMLVKVWKELKIMTQRNFPEDKLIISASKYIIWCFIVYQVNLLFVIIILICHSVKFLSSSIIIDVETAVQILLSMYGVENVFMFIYFHPNYVNHVKRILRRPACAHRVVRPVDTN